MPVMPGKSAGSAKAPGADWQGGSDGPQMAAEQARLKTDRHTP